MKLFRIKISFVIALFIASYSLKAQDHGISIFPVVSAEATVSTSIKSILKSRLSSALVYSDVKAGSDQSPIVISANPIVIEKQRMPGAPPMVGLLLDLQISIKNSETGQVYGSTQVNLKGVGSNESKAYISAIRRFTSSNSSVQSLINNAKKGIKEDLDKYCDQQISKAESLATQNQEKEAIAMLMDSSSSAVDQCHQKVMDAVASYYQKLIDRIGKAFLSEAKIQWETDPTIDGAEKVGELLSQIDPEANCHDDAMKLADNVGKKVKKLTKKEWKFAKKMQKKQANNDNERLEKYKEIATQTTESKE